MRSFEFVAALLSATILSAPLGVNAQELFARDRVGLPDAPNVLNLRLTGDGPGHSDPQVAAAYRDIYVEFIKKYPDWQLRLQQMSGDIGTEQAKMLEQARSGNAPDCASVDSFVLAQFIKNNALADFSPYFSQEEVDDLFPFVKEGITGSDGTIRAWWWSTDLRVLYRNTEIVPDAPQTWEELKQAGISSVAAGKEGILFNGGRYEGTTFDWLANFWAQGGDLVDEQGRPVFGEEENREKLLKAINFYKDLVDSGAAPRRVTTIAGYDELTASAVAGTTALFVGGNWQLAQLRNSMDPEEFAKWTFSPLPGPTLEERSTGTGGWTVASMSDDPVKIEMCATVAREIYMGPGNTVREVLPTRRTLYSEYEVFSRPHNVAFADALTSGRIRPGVPIYPEISNQIQIMMGDVLSNTRSSEEALDVAFKATLEAYERL